MTIELHARTATASILDRPWIGFLLWAILCIGHYTHVLAPLENLALRIYEPIGQAVYGSVATNLVRTNVVEYQSLEAAEQRIQELETRIETLAIANAHLQTMVDDARLLESQQAFLAKQSYRAVPARVISRSSEGLARTITLNQGAEAGIVVGYPVITHDGVLIGKVQSVTDYSAQILLITSLDSLINGLIQNKTASAGLVKGSYTNLLQMELIPQTDTIAAGQTVISSGADQYIPRGLVLGTIESITATPSAIFQTATVTPLFESSQLFIVSVITP